MFNRFVQGLVLAAPLVGAAFFGIARPAQAGPKCLPYVTDSGQIVTICRQEAAAEEDRRGQFPGGLVGAPPEALRGSGR